MRCVKRHAPEEKAREVELPDCAHAMICRQCCVGFWGTALDAVVLCLVTHAGAPFGMPGPFDPAAAAAMAGAYQLGGMPGGDPYAAAAFGMQPPPDAAMFQTYQHANGAALASLMRPNGIGSAGGAPTSVPAPAQGGTSGGGSSSGAPATAPAAGSSSQLNGKQSAAQPAEETATMDKGVASVAQMGEVL